MFLPHGVELIDLNFLGSPRVIATGVYRSASSLALIDPGPSSCLAELRRALESRGTSISDVSMILLTHIHLDHAGATGTVVRHNPRVQVFVHERGTTHMIDPAKLLDSARRSFGDQMDRLWGEVLPVPAANIQSLAGGERVSVGGRDLDVAYTPGHASHHVTYLDRANGLAFVGDTAGVRIGTTPFVFPPTLPPDVDLEAWADSLRLIERWQPGALFVTHFGVSDDVAAHLEEFRSRLEWASDMVRASLEAGESDRQRAADFARAVGRELRARMPEAEAAEYELAARPALCWQGLARYWRKRGEPPA